jgi:hypothetical protein
MTECLTVEEAAALVEASHDDGDFADATEALLRTVITLHAELAKMTTDRDLWRTERHEALIRAYMAEADVAVLKEANNNDGAKMKVWELSLGEDYRGVYKSELFFHFEDAKKMADEWISGSTYNWRWEDDTSASGGCDWISIQQVEVK